MMMMLLPSCALMTLTHATRVCCRRTLVIRGMQMERERGREAAEAGQKRGRQKKRGEPGSLIEMKEIVKKKRSDSASSATKRRETAVVEREDGREV